MAAAHESVTSEERKTRQTKNKQKMAEFYKSDHAQKGDVKTQIIIVKGKN